jgi:phage terminase large subunit
LSILHIPTARVFQPLLAPARYKGAYGGRGSGKSHFFAELMVDRCVAEPGLRAVCVRETQKTLAESSKRTIEDKIKAFQLEGKFIPQADRIVTPGNGAIIFIGMQDYTTGRHAENIKSLEGYKIAWIEEAQTLSERSLSVLRPTIRAEGSEIWASWNPRRKKDAVDEFFRGGELTDGICVQANWRDNPFWTKELEAERQLDLKRYPDRYENIWEGAYATAHEGAYFARLLGDAKREGRIAKVAQDPLLPIYAFVDIGGSGALADAFTIWIAQFVGQAIHVLDYYEAVGQVLAYHVDWLRSHGYQRAIIRLPHDGVNENNITGKRYEQHFRDALFDVPLPVPNQGRGAAALRIEAVRRIFPKVWFNEATTEAGRDALGFYHERKDEKRNVGLGPEHDWSSHAADAFGLMAICYEEPSRSKAFSRKIEYPQMGVA